MKDWSIDKLIWYRNTLQKEFDTLYESQENPVKMRHIGCKLCYVIKLIKEKSKKDLTI